MTNDADRAKWTDELSDEDLAFIKRFVLVSGSLKELAKAYGISYPTIRLRLNRLIDRITILDEQRIESDFERLARVMYTEGRFDMDTLKSLLAAHKTETEADDANDTDTA